MVSQTPLVRGDGANRPLGIVCTTCRVNVSSDIVVFDCTNLIVERGHGHMCVKSQEAVRATWHNGRGCNSIAQSDWRMGTAPESGKIAAVGAVPHVSSTEGLRSSTDEEESSVLTHSVSGDNKALA